MKAPTLLCCLVLPLALVRAEEQAVRNVRDLWGDYDPRAEPLEIGVGGGISNRSSRAMDSG